MSNPTDSQLSEAAANLEPLTPATKSALLTLCAVANEHRRPGGLFTDPDAFISWEALNRAINLDLPPLAPTYINGIILRTLIFDYATLAFCTDHPGGRTRVFDLGCGFSTRFYRLGLSRIGAWVHMDLPQVIKLRKAMREPWWNEGLNACDITDPNLLDWTTGGPETLFIAEGVLSFLDYNSMAAMLTRLKDRFPGATLLGTALLASKFLPADVFWDQLGLRPLWSAPSLQGLQDSWPFKIEQHWILDRILHRFSGLDLTLERVQPDASGLLFRAIL